MFILNICIQIGVTDIKLVGNSTVFHALFVIKYTLLTIIIFNFLLLPCRVRWGLCHFVTFSAFFVSFFHVIFSLLQWPPHLWLFMLALLRSCFKLSSSLSLSLPLLRLHPSPTCPVTKTQTQKNRHALYAILYVCPAHLVLCPTTFLFMCPHYVLFSRFIHLPSILTLYSTYSSNPVLFCYL